LSRLHGTDPGTRNDGSPIAKAKIAASGKYLVEKLTGTVAKRSVQGGQNFTVGTAVVADTSPTRIDKQGLARNRTGRTMN